MYLAGPKKALVDRYMDMFTPEDMKSCAEEVLAATSEELQIWVDHQCFIRRSRRGAQNILDVRWVAKWKRVKKKHDPRQKQRVVRMRMTLRGLKDGETEGLITYDGTSSRTSQKVVTSEAVCLGWTLATIDVEAFLKKAHTRSSLEPQTTRLARSTLSRTQTLLQQPCANSRIRRLRSPA